LHRAQPPTGRDRDVAFFVVDAGRCDRLIQGYGAVIGLRSKAIRTVLRWQLVATGVLAVIAGFVAGANGALSAALGGLISFAAGLGFAAVASLSRLDSAAGAMIGAMRAEAIKIVLIVLLLWLVMATYKNIVVIAFVGTFIVATVLFSAAALVRED
jgi:ATP synthase protein I